MNNTVYNDRDIAVSCLVVSEFQSNCYLVRNRRNEILIVDPGANAPAIRQAVEALGGTVILVVATHGHIDHVMAAQAVKAHYNVPFAVHAQAKHTLRSLPIQAAMFGGRALDPPVVDHRLQDGDKVMDVFSVMHTPGHAPGAVCLYRQGLLLSGDTLFRLSVGRTDLPGGDDMALAKSLKRLFALPGDTVVLPGHGPTTTLDFEKKHNPFAAVR